MTSSDGTTVTDPPKLLDKKFLQPWSRDKAHEWYRSHAFLVGCNFLPSSSVNDIEMWQADTYDPECISREMRLARAMGLNSLRIFLNYIVWESDPDGLKKRLADFLSRAQQHDLTVMCVLLDDCNFANCVAKAGPQADPIPGVHNSQWVSSPPLAMVADQGEWPRIERYVKDIVREFGRDDRLAIWDVYNEPGNTELGETSLPLVEAAFGWVRESWPVQPLTCGVWQNPESRASQRLLELSDIISFHDYGALPALLDNVQIYLKQGRPLICTEWLCRQREPLIKAVVSGEAWLGQRIG